MKIIRGDLVKLAKIGTFQVIVHGCNCYRTMGAGIAKQIKREFPEAYESDFWTKHGDRNKLGTYSFATVKNENETFVTIVNAYTQYRYGNQHDCDYDAIKKVFSKIKNDFTGLKIGYPEIGCGRAGGDWNIVSEIIDNELWEEDHTLVVYKR